MKFTIEPQERYIMKIGESTMDVRVTLSSAEYRWMMEMATDTGIVHHQYDNLEMLACIISKAVKENS